MVTVQTYVPGSLQQLVKSCWYLEVSEQQALYEEEIIPDGHHEIIFHLDRQAARKHAGNSYWHSEPAAFIAGQTLKSYRLQLQPGSRLYGIRFYPHTLYALLGIPLEELTDRIIPLDEMPQGNAFRQCLTESPQATFLNFEKLLQQRFAGIQGRPNGYGYVHAAVMEMLQHGGHITIDHLIRKTGVSVKYLDTLFYRYVGVAPKTVSSILKLNRFIAYKTRHPEKTFTDCCYEAGYYDQSHLIRSFRLFTDRSPKAYFRNSGHINDVFTAL